ncbi:MAG: TonB-dependent receptor, partial [Aeromicrobium sp.]|nr:TonB-dependent receptor [Burkholderiales bacterium]
AGGLIIVTKPVVGPLQGRTTLLKTSDGEWRASASFGGELSDTLGVRVAASKSDFEGNLNNLTTGKKVNGSAGQTFMAKIAWRPTSELEIQVSPYSNKASNTRSANALNKFLITNTGTNAATQGAIGERQQGGVGGSNTLGVGGGSLPVFLIPANSPATFPATATSINTIPASVSLAGITPTQWNRNIRRDYPGGIESKNDGVGVRAVYSLPNDLTLTSITAYERYKATDYFDRDFGDQPVQVVPTSTAITGTSIVTLPVSVGNPQRGTYDIRSRSQEFRLTSGDSGSVRYVLGLWYGKNETARWFNRGDCRAPTVCSAASVGGPVVYQADVYNINKAIFGQASWDFYPTYTVLAGLRSNEETSGYNFARNYFTQVTPETFVPGAAATNVFQVRDNVGRSVTGKLSLQRQFNEDWMGYVMTASGHKGVAYDLLSGLNTNSSAPVAPEDAVSMEVGVKANLLQNRMSFSATAFNSEFKNYQQAMTVSLGEGAGTISKLSSLPKVRTRGVELETSAVVIPGLNISASYAYTEATIQEWKAAACYTDATNVRVGTTIFAANGSIAGRNNKCFPGFAGDTAGVQDLAGASMFNAPKHKLAVSGIYEIRLPSLPFNAFVNGNFKYQSAIITNIIQDPDFAAPGFKVVDVGFGIKEKKDRFKLSFLANNVLDKQYAINGFGQAPSYRGSVASPASVSITAWRPERDTWRYFTVRFDMKF